MDLAADGLALIDAGAGRVLRANARADALLGLEPGGLAGMTGPQLAALIHPDDAPTARAAAMEIQWAKPGATQEVAALLESDDGAWVPVSVAAGVLDRKGVGGAPRLLTLARRVRVSAVGPPLERDDLAPGGLERALESRGLAVATWEARLDGGDPGFRASARWAEMLGLEEGDAPKSFEELLTWIHAADRDRVLLDIRTHVEGLSRSFESEFRMKAKDGTYKWLRAGGRVTHTDGEPRLIGYQEDIGRRKRLEQALMRSERRFRALVEHNPDAIAVHRDGRVVFCNPRLAEWLGRGDPAQMKGAPVIGLVHPDDTSRLGGQLRTLSRTTGRSGPPVELRLRRASGEAVYAEVSSVRMDFDGAQAVFTVFRDLSERKRMEAQLAQNERMASLGQLAAGVAHEINNPLTYVNMNLSGVLEDLPSLARDAGELRAWLRSRLGDAPLPAELDRLLTPDTYGDLARQIEDAYDGSRRIQGIVADLKAFTRDAGEPGEPVALACVLRTAIQMALPQIRYQANVVEQIGDPQPVLGNDGRLCQVFLNLLVNAAQAIPAEAAPGRVVVRLAQRGEEVIAEIQDDGVGIPQEHLPRLFEPFFSTKPTDLGSGLGLPICKHIVESFGGRIEVESVQGEGTLVRVRLRATDAPLASAAPAVEEELTSPGLRPRILLVDDEARLVESVRRGLSRDFDVVCANGGRAALEILERDMDFGLILCDLMMPDVSGAEVFEWLRRRSPALADQLVFITGGAVGGEARRFLDETDCLVVSKPLDLKHLRRLARRLARAAPDRRPPLRAVPAPDRRAGPRFPGGRLSGVLDTGEAVARCRVVDYSVSGLRLSGRSLAVDDAGREPLTVLLRGDDRKGVVQARVTLIREVETTAGRDLCFRILGVDDDYQSLYDAWLSEAAHGPH